MEEKLKQASFKGNKHGNEEPYWFGGDIESEDSFTKLGNLEMYHITTNGGKWKAKTCNGQTPQPRQMSPAQELDEKQADKTSAKSPTGDEDPPRKIAPAAPLEGAGTGGNNREGERLTQSYDDEASELVS